MPRENVVHTFDELNEGLGLGLNDSPKNSLKSPRPNGTVNAKGSHDAYIREALTDECRIVANTAEGGRNHQVNKSAHALGTLVAHGLDQALIESEILAAAIDAGLPEHEAKAAIHSGVTAGLQSPRQLPKRSVQTSRATFAPNTSAPPKGSELDTIIIDSPEPLRLAELYLEKEASIDELPILVRSNENFYRYNAGTGYAIENLEALKAKLYTFIDRIRTPRRDKSGQPETTETGHPKLKKVPATKRIVDEVVCAIPACKEVLLSDAPPVWRREPESNLDPSKIICLENGLLDIETGTLHAPTPLFFSLNTLPFAYDSAAIATPTRWLDFLNQLFPDDAESIRALNFWFGYCLSANSDLQKILLLIGPTRSGKGCIARVQRALLGARNVAGPTLTSLSGPFGLAPLVNKGLAIVSDARLSGRSDQAAITENLLRISGQDLATIDRKFLPSLEVQLGTRFMLLTNELPRLADNSGALAKRFVIIRLTRSFYGVEDPNLTHYLLEELPQIFNWSLEGLRGLRARGSLIQPESGAEMVRTMKDLASPITVFLNEHCEIGPSFTAIVSEVFERWKTWCASVGRDHPGTVQTFARDLHAGVPGLTTRQITTTFGRPRAYQGLRLLDD